MKLENAFTVPVPRADAWQVLLDVERVAPCMPGATLTSLDGDSFSGTVKVKVGPINLTYAGQARFVTLDEESGVAVIEGSGKETRGTGTAKALITCRLVEDGGSTRVDVETDLAITGKPAQFGRGVLADVSGKLIDRFAASLSQEIQGGGSGAASGLASPIGHEAGPAVGTGDGAVPLGQVGSPGLPTAGAALQQPPAPPTGSGQQPGATGAAPRRPHAAREAEPLDLLETAGMPVLARVAPVGGAVLGLLLAYLLGRRRGAAAVRRALPT